MLLTAGVGCAQRPAAAARWSDWLLFDCESGSLVKARYAPSGEQAQLEREGRRHLMQRAVAASGARYVGDGLEWWSKGSGAGAAGMLRTAPADGSSAGERLDTCVQR